MKSIRMEITWIKIKQMEKVSEWKVYEYKKKVNEWKVNE